MIILGSFPDEEALNRAVDALRDKGLEPVETYTPNPPEAKTTILRPIMLAAGILGAIGGFALQAITTGVFYPIDIGGRPNVFWPSYMFFTLETGLLCAMTAGFLGFLIINRLPRLYDPVDESDHFRHAMQDGWFLALRTDDAHHINRAKDVLSRLRPIRLEELEA